MRRCLLLFLVLTLVSVGCRKGEEKPLPLPVRKKEVKKTVRVSFPRVVKLRISPSYVTQQTDLRAELECVPENHPFTVHYSWFLNATPVGRDEPVLDHSHLKKGAYVWVRVFFEDPQTGATSKLYESPRYRVENSPPVIESEFPSVKNLKPGDLYTYRVRYSDPDDPEETLKLELVRAPQGASLEGDLLKWRIPEKEGEYEFVLKVSDPSGLYVLQKKKIIIKSKTVRTGQASSK